MRSGYLRQREEELFHLAEHIPYGDYARYGLPLFWEDQFFRTRTDLEVLCSQKGVAVPLWVWAAERAGFLLDAPRILEREVDLYELVPEQEVERLQDLLDEWSTALVLDAFNPDYERAVLLNTEPR